jgi:hypothetical protein
VRRRFASLTAGDGGAGPRQQRAQLRHRQLSAYADQAEGGPQTHDDERIRHQAAIVGGFRENSPTDVDADDECRSAGEPDDPAEIVRV